MGEVANLVLGEQALQRVHDGYLEAGLTGARDRR